MPGQVILSAVVLYDFPSSQNTALGHATGDLIDTGNKNVIIGADADVNTSMPLIKSLLVFKQLELVITVQLEMISPM